MAKKKTAKRKEFTFQGSLELRGVVFFVTATDEAHAREKARAGEWEEWDVAGAEGVNWTLDPSTCEAND